MQAEPLPETRTGSSLGRLWEVFLVALRLGLTSFGGPIAHIGYYRDVYVVRRKWLDEKTFGDVVALCQVLPGPASSQVGMTIGMMRAGLLGGVAQWIGFTLPSAVALTLFAYGIASFDVADAGWLRGLKLVAVPVVAQAVWGMARALTPDKQRVTLAIVATIATLLLATAWGQVAIIAAAAVIGWRFLGADQAAAPARESAGPRRYMGATLIALTVLGVLLIGLPIARQFVSNHLLAQLDSFFRVGSLVFGGGHVVLPLLQHEVVPTGWVTTEQFLGGYGAAQAVPGPLFTFSAYLGAVMHPGPLAWLYGIATLVAVFLPGFLFVVARMPLWDLMRTHKDFQAAIRGVNAAVVGILLAALYDPIWTNAVKTPADFSLALALFGLLMFWRMPPWVVVVCAALGGAAIAYVGG
ncbi:MAG: chromate efflux transporter [Chloroflexi bacterium]|nr:chromate efflux transporter [Chloroflexota bacterium]